MSDILSELTSHCIRCGFCLESCPTFMITGEETEGPRGRIYLVRSAEEGKLSWEDVAPHLDRCLGCRSCETACPSGVEYGAIFELAKAHVEKVRPKPWRRRLINGLTDAKKAQLQFKLAGLLPGRKLPGFVNRLVSDQEGVARIPRPQRRSYPPLDESTLPPIKGEVALLKGCVMQALFDPVHAATERLLRRCGYRVIAISTGCCGALDAHSGLLDSARIKAYQMVNRLPPDVPIIVNSAGCGSMMKEYGSLDPNLGPIAERVKDASEFLLEVGLTQWLAKSPGIEATVTYHDACHLAHGQGIRQQPRDLIKAIPKITFKELDRADRCCGSAGIYNIQQPQFAKQLLDWKWKDIEDTGAQFVVSGNPGCHAWLDQANEEHDKPIRVLHTMELLEASFSRAQDSIPHQ